MKRKMACGMLLVLAVGAPIQAGPHGCGGWSIGVGVGAPAFYRPWYPSYGYYYRPYPVYVAPPPVIVQPAPVIQAVPVVQPAPAAPVYQAPAPAPLSPTMYTADNGSADVEHHLHMLSSNDERTRADSVLQLGRLKAQRAVDPLAATLAGDRSPAVRETAARALGLIGSAQALTALKHAAMSDSDHDVRRSAQFAIEIIQSR